jgi:hypothetical protein
MSSGSGPGDIWLGKTRRVVSIALSHPFTMRSIPVIILTALLPLLLQSCCSDAKVRFWKFRDGKGGAAVYAVDTEKVPLSSLAPAGVVYLDRTGRAVHPASPKQPKQISEAEWRAATPGARLTLLYCGKCKGCWAKVRGR